MCCIDCICIQGFVDDMAQDVSDVLAFVHQHCDIYFMDKVIQNLISRFSF